MSSNANEEKPPVANDAPAATPVPPPQVKSDAPAATDVAQQPQAAGAIVAASAPTAKDNVGELKDETTNQLPVEQPSKPPATSGSNPTVSDTPLPASQPTMQPVNLSAVKPAAVASPVVTPPAVVPAVSEPPAVTTSPAVTAPAVVSSLPAVTKLAPAATVLVPAVAQAVAPPSAAPPQKLPQAVATPIVPPKPQEAPPQKQQQPPPTALQQQHEKTQQTAQALVALRQQTPPPLIIKPPGGHVTVAAAATSQEDSAKLQLGPGRKDKSPSPLNMKTLQLTKETSKPTIIAGAPKPAPILVASAGTLVPTPLVQTRGSQPPTHQQQQHVITTTMPPRQRVPSGAIMEPVKTLIAASSGGQPVQLTAQPLAVGPVHHRLPVAVTTAGAGGGGGILKLPSTQIVPATLSMAHVPVTSTMVAVPSQPHHVAIATMAQQPGSLPRAQFIGHQTHHVVQRHPPPLRMVHLPTASAVAAAAAADGRQRMPNLPQSPISIRHALPQAPLTVRGAAAAAQPVAVTSATTIGVPHLTAAAARSSPQAAAVRHPPQLPQQPLLRQTLPAHAMQAGTTIGGARMPSSVAAIASGHTIQHRHLTTSRAGEVSNSFFCSYLYFF